MTTADFIFLLLLALVCLAVYYKLRTPVVQFKKVRVVRFPKNGQKMYQLNLISLEMCEVEPTGEKYHQVEADHIYCIALNENNAIKQFNKMVPGKFERA